MGSVFSNFSHCHILLDHHLDKAKLIKLKKRHRLTLSQFTVHGYPTLARGILIFLKKSSGATISNISTNNNKDTLHFTLTLPDQTQIDVLAVYAPSKDNPNGFWNTVQAFQAKAKLNTGS